MADPPPVLTLLVKKGPCKGETLQGRAGAGPLRVGRVAKGNDLALRDAGASESHLTVQFLPPPAARWAVTDLGSSNGTILNDAPLVPTVPAPLAHGDIIKIGGSTVLAVSISTDAGPAGTRRSARNASAVAAAAEKEDEEAPAVTRRAGRKKAAAAEPPGAVKEVKDEAAVVTRRGGRKKAAEPPDEEKEAKEEAAVPARRGGRKKAAGPSDAEKEEKEEPAVQTRRGQRKKAAEAPEVEMEEEEEEEKAAGSRRGGPRKAVGTGALPSQPQNTRSTRAAARRDEAAGCRKDEEKVSRTGNGRGRVTRASARKATDAAAEEEEDEAEVAVARDREGNPTWVTAAKGGEEEDMVETRSGTSNALDVPASVRRRTTRSRRGRGRATRASTRNADDAVVEEDEKEQVERDMADGRESRGSPLRVNSVNDGGKEDKVATGVGKLDGTSKASMECEKMVDVEEEIESLAPEGQIRRATGGRVSAQHAPAGNGGMEEDEGKDSSRGDENEGDQELKREKMVLESKLDGVGEEEEHDKREAIDGNGEERCVKESTGGIRLEDMTLGEWFVRIEKYLLAKNEEVAEKEIAKVRETHRRFCEHLKTLKTSSDPS